MTLEEAIAPDLPLETFEEVYRRLLRALRRKKGFGLFFVLQSDYAQGNQIIEGIRQDLPQKKIAVLQIDRKTKTLYDKIAELKEQEPFDILFIRGIENALYEYQDTKRISGWTEQEIYAYSWKGVPPILSHLNQQRERFSQDFPCSLVFFAPSFAINYFIQRAPDFFDWRSGLFHFPLTEEEVYIRENNLVAERVKECLKLTLQELVDTKLQIDDLMAQRHNSPETTAKGYCFGVESSIIRLLAFGIKYLNSILMIMQHGIIKVLFYSDSDAIKKHLIVLIRLSKLTGMILEFGI